MTDSQDDELIRKLNQEASKIPWSELLRFFAAGKAVAVDPQLDLIQVAISFSNDRAEEIQSLMAEGKIGQVKDEQAKQWLDDNQLVWAVVIAPWVLVQRV